MNELLKRPLNDWKIEPDYGKGEHHYLVDGARYPSMTTVLKCLDKPALLPWAVKMMEKKATELFAKECDPDGNIVASFPRVQQILEDAKKNYRDARDSAADIGTIVHDSIERFILEGQMPDDPSWPLGVKNGLSAFAGWLSSGESIKPVRVEAYLASKKFKIAGKCDFIGYIGSKLVVADWKTSTGIYDEMKFQVAGYAGMIEEMTGRKLDGAYIVKFDKKEGEFNPKKDVSFIDADEVSARFKAFAHLAAYSRLTKELA
jgi:hypothetical protein